MRLIDRLERRYAKIVAEADEPDADSGTDEPDSGAEGNSGQDAAGDDPSIQANPSAGTFVSDTKLAEFAKTLIDAYLAEPPKREEIPSDLLNVTTRNSSAVIDYVRNLLALNRDTSTDGSDTEIENQLR